MTPYSYSSPSNNWSDFDVRLELLVDVTLQSYISFNPTGGLAGSLAFGFNAGTTSVEVMRIANTYQGGTDTQLPMVGIGTTSPAYTLDISGNLNFSGSITHNGSTFTTSQWSNNSTGYVSIGTSSPASTLDVSGNVTADAYVTTSDYRIKENVTAVDECSYNCTVDTLRPVMHRSKHTGRTDVGLIVHEVQEVFPFLVNGSKDDESLQSVHYTGLIGILTHEIQRLKREMAKEREEREEMRRQLDALRA